MTIATDGREETVVGSLGGTDIGDTLEITGVYTEHAVYGSQFKAERYVVTLPDDAEAMERYLASGAIKGVREKLAASIVKVFGADTFRIMEEEPERLHEIKGVSLKKAREIGEQMREKKENREALVFVQRYGVSNTMALRIITHYGGDVYRVLRENPYRLAEDIDGIGFRTADEIARRNDVAVSPEYRMRGAIQYLLSEAMAEGHVYLPETVLEERLTELIGGVPDPQDTEESPQPMDVLLTLQMDGKVVLKGKGEDPKVYLSYLYREESDAVRLLKELAAHTVVTPTLRDTGDGALVLAKEQRKAVDAALSNGVVIITGGPGTGKTTTIKTILTLFEKNGLDVLCAAPTGRAAKRMQEATGFEAKTIHRLLEVNAAPEGNGRYRATPVFERDESNPLEADAVIIDETSMVDIRLFHALLKAILPGTHLILVGDADQLPSVGPGQVLKDLIASKRFPTIVLDKIFRQAKESDIVLNAHRVNHGEAIELTTRGRDFFFMERDNAAVIQRNLVTMIRDKLPDYVGTTANEIQVLTPMKKGALGAETLNVVLQEQLNPSAKGKDEAVIGERIFRLGDKLMQIKNNYQTAWEVPGRYGIPAARGKGVFNGDMGELVEIDTTARTLRVKFDEGRIADYPFADTGELQLAYAVTIHKSQGSEYPAVLIPILGGPRMLLNRNLLYTALTRAKALVVLIGSRSTVLEMIGNDTQLKRYTGLRELLEGAG